MSRPPTQNCPAASEPTFSSPDVDGTEVAASGEETAFEPPWLVGYRLFIGSRVHGIRVTCTADARGTRIHIHQPDDGTALLVDLARLTRALAAAAG